MKTIVQQCPECSRPLSPIEAYQVINVQHFVCPQCKTRLKAGWQIEKEPLKKRIISSLLWSIPTAIAMFGVWYYPEKVWWMVGALGVFHLISLVIICVGGHYEIRRKEK